jgi:hypothetical protein
MGFLPGPKPSLVGIGWLGWHAAEARELPGSLPSLAGAGPCRPGIRHGEACHALTAGPVWPSSPVHEHSTIRKRERHAYSSLLSAAADRRGRYCRARRWQRQPRSRPRRRPARRAARHPLPRGVEGDNPVVPGKERHLHLPVPGVHDGPGGQQQEVRLAGAVHLVVNSHARVGSVTRFIGQPYASVASFRRAASWRSRPPRIDPDFSRPDGMPASWPMRPGQCYQGNP